MALRLVFGYILALATIFILYILIQLLLIYVNFSRSVNRLLKETNQLKENKIDFEIDKQSSSFCLWLILLRFMGILLPLLLSIKITFELLYFFRSAILARSFDFMLFASTMEVFLISNESFLIVAIFPWLLYYIFAYIQEKGILTLRKIATEKKTEKNSS